MLGAREAQSILNPPILHQHLSSMGHFVLEKLQIPHNGPGVFTRTQRWGLEIANLQSSVLLPFLFGRPGGKDA